ncbi:Protein EPIDERMAL PATTERNING FACTOR 1 [Carex littledalei]|uniref:Epidermal patterning factor-like protein n=1 Tax=Carex littledalei TaxID=544730 RepID=A0A833VXD0_9POAL|nr:Protein EPIDERMAL PATTERNING FACTOR 1 [Carex littledalei]
MQTVKANDGLKSPALETRAIEAEALTWYARRPRHPSITKKKTSNRSANHNHETVEIVGSRLPDCSHACGSCSPCRLVMISFVCASLEEAETCPMAYKCMCHSKSYPVP